MASYDTFMALKDYSRGKIQKWELVDSDPDIYHVGEDRSNRGQSTIKLGFNDDKFWGRVGLNDDDVWFMNAINSPYSDYEFIDSYSIKEDFRNGYSIFHELNEDNIEKLKQISRYIFPMKFDLENDEFKSGLSEKLLSSFKNETQDILDDYQSEKNREMTQVAQESIEKELTNYFNDFGFTYVAGDEFTTTVANLVMWYIKENMVHVPIAELLPKIFQTNKIDVGGWLDNSYEYQDSEKFDSDSFNNYVGRKLDDIIEKIEDGGNGDFSMQEYLDMVDRVGKKFEVGRWHTLPKKKDVRFYIENFEMNPNKVIVKLSKELKQRTLKLSEENFYHLLYQPTLFNLEEI
jgi:hypothetical protein